MIYLIRVRYEEVTLLKVGYAKNIKKRLDQYTTENPLFELLDYREGDKKLESFLHGLFKDYKFEKGREWFYYANYIVEHFNMDFTESMLINTIKDKLKNAKSFSKRLKLYCEFKRDYPNVDFKIENFQIYLDLIGIDRCRILKYKEHLLYKELYDFGQFNESNVEDEKILHDFLEGYFYKTNKFRERMKMYCEFSDRYKDNKYIMEALRCRVDSKYLHYYSYYGTKGCSSRHYQEGELLLGWNDATKSDKLKSMIYDRFSSGDKIAKSTIKSRLKDIYDSLSLSKTPKATDLEEYFKLSKTNVIVDGISKNGFKLGDKLLPLEPPSGNS